MASLMDRTSNSEPLSPTTPSRKPSLTWSDSSLDECETPLLATPDAHRFCQLPAANGVQLMSPPRAWTMEGDKAKQMLGLSDSPEDLISLKARTNLIRRKKANRTSSCVNLSALANETPLLSRFDDSSDDDDDREQEEEQEKLDDNSAASPLRRPFGSARKLIKPKTQRSNSGTTSMLRRLSSIASQHHSSILSVRSLSRSSASSALSTSPNEVPPTSITQIRSAIRNDAPAASAPVSNTRDDATFAFAPYDSVAFKDNHTFDNIFFTAQSPMSRTVSHVRPDTPVPSSSPRPSLLRSLSVKKERWLPRASLPCSPEHPSALLIRTASDFFKAVDNGSISEETWTAPRSVSASGNVGLGLSFDGVHDNVDSTSIADDRPPRLPSYDFERRAPSPLLASEGTSQRSTGSFFGPVLGHFSKHLPATLKYDASRRPKLANMHLFRSMEGRGLHFTQMVAASSEASVRVTTELTRTASHFATGKEDQEYADDCIVSKSRPMFLRSNTACAASSPTMVSACDYKAFVAAQRARQRKFRRAHEALHGPSGSQNPSPPLSPVTTPLPPLPSPTGFLRRRRETIIIDPPSRRPSDADSPLPSLPASQQEVDVAALNSMLMALRRESAPESPTHPGFISSSARRYTAGPVSGDCIDDAEARRGQGSIEADYIPISLSSDRLCPCSSSLTLPTSPTRTETDGEASFLRLSLASPTYPTESGQEKERMEGERPASDFVTASSSPPSSSSSSSSSTCFFRTSTASSPSASTSSPSSSSSSDTKAPMINSTKSAEDQEDDDDDEGQTCVESDTEPDL